MDTNTTLESLLHLCADGVAGYRHAATAIREPKLHAALWKNASEREEIAAVLTNALVARGIKPAHNGSAKGAVHRAWLDAIAALESDNVAAILRECDRGDLVTCDAFESALAGEIGADLKKDLEKQLARIVEARTRIAEAQATLDGRENRVRR
jgi:uncharacterized protein (TIGR02284 family)